MVAESFLKIRVRGDRTNGRFRKFEPNSGPFPNLGAKSWEPFDRLRRADTFLVRPLSRIVVNMPAVRSP